MHSRQIPIVVFEEFLSASELFSLHAFYQEHENDFLASMVLTNDGSDVLDHDFRRSRVLYDVGHFQDLIDRRISDAFSLILYRLRMVPFQVSGLEVQLTASNHGEFFSAHTDSDSGSLRTRALTFVYYCHREPRGFQGGELRLYGRDPISGSDRMDVCHVIHPVQNRIVFFPSDRLHEVAPVFCSSRSFVDSRFTLNGWLRR